ncbi:TonB-dependent receptor domain-containing protein [Mucisphaera sp.]|uniref:TonB-dependent receptor n=1 Tax=Mucisphaera sp. TaxID=2913024 RepID=UPI003D10DA84
MIHPSRSLYLASAVVLATASAAYAQEVGAIRGTVFDADFDAPLRDATVTITETGQQTTTGLDGGYTFGEVPPGQYTLVFARDGFLQQVEAGVLVTEGQLTDLNATLAGDFAEMDEFIVQDIQLGGDTDIGLLELRIESPALIDAVGADLLSQAGAGDAEAGLKLVAGSTTTADGFAAVRGLPPRFISTQLNGVVLPSADPDTRAVQLDLFPSDIIESIQVSKTFTPDQQGQASGGAVNIVTKSIPDQNFLKISTGTEYNTNRPGNGEFLVDSRGGPNFFGIDGDRALPGSLAGLTGNPPELPNNFFGNPGPNNGNPPIEYDWSVATGVQHEFDTGVRVGGLFTYFYEQDMTHRENVVNHDKVISTNNPNAGLIPNTSGSNQNGFLQTTNLGEDQILTSLFNETESSHQVVWGSLATLGIESDLHEISFTYMFTQNTAATATVGEDTLGKNLKFPGHDPLQIVTPGGAQDPTNGNENTSDFAPYRRLETQEYLERTVETFQLSGQHTLASEERAADTWNVGPFEFMPPVFDWNVARSTSQREEPGTLIFDTKYFSASPGRPDGSQEPVTFEGASGALGAFNIVFQDIQEDSTQYGLNLRFPFRQWNNEEGYLKIGYFNDQVTRDFRQDTFTIPEIIDGQINENVLLLSPFGGVTLSEAIANPGLYGDLFFDPLPGVPINLRPPIPFFQPANDPGAIIATPIDFQYTGEQDVQALYWMVDLPITPYLKVIGGLRFESTNIGTNIVPDTPTTEVFLDAPVLIDNGGTLGTPIDVNALPAGTLDATIDQDDILPAIAFILEPIDNVMIRAGYSETIARPTFRELTPVSQSLFFGQTPFVGNPFLEMSSIKNYDLRIDYRPFPDTLFSASYFYKDLTNPIQVVRQAQGINSIVVPVNFPSGQIEGYEVEVRQSVGRWFEPLQGMTIGGNATLLNTEVELRPFERDQLNRSGIRGNTIEMINAPEHLYNLYVNYNQQDLGTSISLFYTVRGDTLVTPAGVKDDGGVGSGAPAAFVLPAVYEEEFGTLNLTIVQRLTDYLSLKFSAKNLLDPDIQTVYKGAGVRGNNLRTSYNAGIDLSLGITFNYEF